MAGRTRIVVLVTSVVFGAVAAVLAYGYLSGVQKRADGGARSVGVYVVKKVVVKGTSGALALQSEAVARGSIPARFRPATAVTDPVQINGEIAAFDLAPDEVVVQGMFVAPASASSTNSQRLPPGLVAVAISVDAVRGLGGILAPGDTVNIMTPVTLLKKRLSAASQAYLKDAVDGDRGWAVLYQNVKILFIGATPAQETGAAAPPPQGGGTITFALPQEAALRLVFAATDAAGGGLYLTLVPPGNAPADVPPVVNANEFGPPCQSQGPDNRYGTADDVPAGCVSLVPYAPAPATAPQP